MRISAAFLDHREAGKLPFNIQTDLPPKSSSSSTTPNTPEHRDMTMTIKFNPPFVLTTMTVNGNDYLEHHVRANVDYTSLVSILIYREGQREDWICQKKAVI